MPSYHVIRLDDDMNAVGELPRITSLSVDRSITDKASLLESCSIEIDCETIPALGWFRIERHGESQKDVLGTFWLESDSTSINMGVMKARLTGRSVLMRPSEEKMPNGSWAKAGSDAPSVAAAMLSGCPFKPTWSGSAAMPNSIVFKDKCTALEAAWMVLDSVGWRIRLDGYGRVFLEPMPDEAAITIAEDSDGIIPGVSLESDGIAYSRSYSDDTYPGDIVRVHLPKYGVEYSGRVMAQSMSAAPLLRMSEKIGAGR